ncbi:hypothetical protein LTR28_013336, partial [Elasticomyces elasticus]
MELTPTNKILWSTDGHHFPETYWLANKQFREVIEKVLVEFIREGDLTPARSIEMVTDVMFNNSNKLYNLGLTLDVADMEGTATDVLIGGPK